jgi:branched-chain amino acid transport system substrate-binding protein
MSPASHGLHLLLLLLFSGPSYAGEFIIGMSAPFTGESRGIGIDLYRGTMAFIQHVNSTGGVNGRKIAIEAYDDQGNPLPAIRNTIRLIEKDSVFLLYGYVGTATVTRILPLLKQYSAKHIYLFFPFSGGEPSRQPPYDEYVFNQRASHHEETEGLVDNLVRVGRKRIAVFYQMDAYGRSGWDGVRSALQKYGLKMAGEVTYRRGISSTESLQRQVDILRAAEPDAIISIATYAASAAFIRDARDAGWNIPIANISTVGSAILLNKLLEFGRTKRKDYTSQLINSRVVPSYEDISLPAVRQYRELMEKYDPRPPKEITEPGYPSQKFSSTGLEGFLNAKLLVEILKRMGPAPEKASLRVVAEGIKNLDIGINAPESFAARQHQGLHSVYYVTFMNGSFVPISDWSDWAK